ncbi:uncharacterized protein [Halyomorpha halys]|uniref:uncharacterized protein n=1 Tax=Halyomorpha halys TaxID=286706 RepID=UPI0034D2C1DE|nr:Gustatory receptor 160 [Halyomorpha halys]
MLRRFESVLATVFIFSMVFGTFPMKRYPGMSYRFSWKLYGYSIVLGLIACIEGTYWMIAEIQYYLHSASIIISSIVFWFNIYTWVSVLIHYYLQRENLSNIVSRLYTIHCNIGITSYRRRYAVSLIFLTLFNAIPSIWYVIEDAEYFTDIFFVSTYFLFVNIPVIMACQYSVLMGLLTDQLAFLTKQLCLPMFSFDVRQLVENHHALCILADRINKGFNIFLLQATAIPFVVIVVNVYIIVVCIVKPEEFADESKLLTSALEAFVNVGIIVVIVTAAKGAEESAMSFNVQLWNNILISRTLGKDDDLKIYVFMKNSIQQTAFGFYKLDYSLLTAMTTGALTYVIILVQFTLLR